MYVRFIGINYEIKIYYYYSSTTRKYRNSFVDDFLDQPLNDNRSIIIRKKQKSTEETLESHFDTKC